MNLLKKLIPLAFNLCFIHFAIATSLRRILPTSLQIREGEDLQLRLTEELNEQDSCHVWTPTLVDYNLKDIGLNSNARIKFWTENGECGVRIKNIRKEDEGRWRIVSTNATQTLVDAADVEVLDKLDLTTNEFSILSGLNYRLKLANNTAYCDIRHPHSTERTLVAGDCEIDVIRPSAADGGKWIATTGIIGQIQEVPVTANLSIFRSKLVSGYKKSSSSNSIRVFCNVRNSEIGLELCRVITPGTEQIGLQLREGLHNGRYAYYGRGLDNGECGITIESPQQSDYGQWYCVVGIKGEQPIGVYIEVPDGQVQRSTIKPQAIPAKSVTTTLGNMLKMECSANVALSYCWFKGPTGELLTPSPSLEQQETYRYVGRGLGKGECSVEITSADIKHQGQWSCHMGPAAPGIELVSTINVKIAETPLSAQEDIITVGKMNERVSLTCKTVPNQISLQYCRFYSPDGTGIHINEEITENSPLVLNNVRYWFSGNSLRLGDCGLTIDRVSSKHIGEWFCAARLEIETTNNEAIDNIQLIMEGSDDIKNSYAAAATGITMGVLVVLGVFVFGTLYATKKFWKKGNLQSNQPERRSSSEIGSSNAFEMMSVCSSDSIMSTNSESSSSNDAPSNVINPTNR